MVARYLGTFGYHSVTVLIISGGFAGLMAYHNVLSRYLFSLGVDGILPRGIGIPHPRLKSPHRPSLLVSGFTTLSVLGVAICGVPPEALYVQLRSEEHTSELQSLMRISYAVFCLTKKITQSDINQ